MKVYAAIGHFKESRNTTSVALKCNTKAEFMQDLKGNEFVPYIVITPQTWKQLQTEDTWEQVKRMTTNYRVWNLVTEYICQCMDILAERIKEAE